MVLDSILEKILSKVLGNLFYGIKKQNIKTDLLKGNFKICNIGLHPNLFENMNLPFDIYYSYVEKIDLTIPWRTEQPLTLNISTIYAILVYKQDWDLKTVNRKKKQAEIKEFLNDKLKSKNEKKQVSEDKGSGAIANRIEKFIDNLQVNISSIHFRFESIEKGYSFGIKVEDIVCSTVNQEGFSQYFIREKAKQNFVRYILNIDPLSIYVNPNEKCFLSTKKQFADITNAMAHMDRSGGLKNSYGKQVVGMGVQTLKFILSLSIKANLRKYFEKDKSLASQKIQSEVNFHEIQLSIGHEQFHVVMDMVNRLIAYQQTCHSYQARVEINVDKERDASEIISLMKRKKTDKQKVVLKKMARTHLGWVFRMTYLRILQKKFLREIMKRDITVEDIFENRKLQIIISRVNIKSIKEWIDIAFIIKDNFKKNTNVFNKSQSKLESYVNQHLDQMIDSWTASKVEEIQEKKGHENFGFKLYMNVHSLSVKISKQNMFGMGVQITNLNATLWKRQSKNLILEFLMQDLQFNAFNALPGQKTLTYVPFLYRNKNVQVHDLYLLRLKFEKSPIGNPFVFSTTSFKFNSIEIMIYPQIYRNIYETFMEEASKPKKQKKTHKKMQKLPKKNVNVPASMQMIQQYNIIEGVVHSPWIVIPLSSTNDYNKECWVLRLGDLNIATKDVFLKRDYYESLTLELKHFQLKYFNSIKFFHTWLHNNMNMSILSKMPNSKSNKIIDVIEPISCYVDLKVLKKSVKETKKKNRQFIIMNIKIDQVFINLHKLIVQKLKNRVDLFEDSKKTQLIQMKPKNIIQDHTISGVANVNTDKIKNMPMFVVLKNYHLYFFYKDSRDRIILTEDVRQNTIRLTSDHHSYLNQGKSKKINLQLKDQDKHSEWHKHIDQIISVRDRKQDTNLITSIRNKKKFSKLNVIKEEGSENSQDYIESSKKNKNRQNNEEGSHQDPTLLKITFTMNSLSIQLIDDNDNEFLECSFQKTQLSYGNLQQKVMNFSISDWNVLQKSQKRFNQADPRKNIPFLGSKRFFNEKKKQESEKLQNFLNLKASFSDITGELTHADITIDQLYISWDISIFTKILSFFFYRYEADDAPSVANPDKKVLSISFKMNRFYLYCFHDETELLALFKFHFINIQYAQSKIQELYKVKCQKFEAEKFIDSDAMRRMPMIVCRKNRHVSMLRQSALEEGIYDEDYIMDKPQTDREERQGLNPLSLEYHIRKKETQKFTNVSRLKRKFGEDVIVSEMICHWKDTIIYFQQEQTFRLLNFFLNQILSTVTSKFKKRQYSENYIHKALQIKKITTFDAKLSNLIVLVPPHERNNHFLEIIIDNIYFSKNIRSDKPEFEPQLKVIETKKGKAQVFYDTIVFDIEGVMPFYKFGSQPSIPIVKNPLNLEVSYGKLSFPREYEPILSSIDAIDKTIWTKVRVFPEIKVQMQKIIFVTFLQIFYQNIKHRDGKAEKFQTPQKYPPKKIFKIVLEKLTLNLYEYEEKSEQLLKTMRRSSRRMSVYDTKQVLKKFQKFKADSGLIDYENIGAKSNIKISLNNLSGGGQLPIKKNISDKKTGFSLEMFSDDGQMTLNLRPSNYELQVNLDKLTQVIEFINYDSEYVANKIMPKKKKQSWQNISIFPEYCCIKIGDIRAEGTFRVTYFKDFKNPVNDNILEYLSEEIKQKDKKLFMKNYLEQISDKQIKVNGQNVSIYVKGQPIGQLESLFFSRLQLLCKTGHRRFKRQLVNLGGLKVHANLMTLKTLFSVYSSHVKKSPYFKQKLYFQPCHAMPPKVKPIQKRVTTVEFQRSVIHLLKIPESNSAKIYLQPYFTLEFMIPKILYATWKNQQQISIVNLNGKILQTNSAITPKTLVSIRDFSLDYFTDKGLNEKKIDLQNARNVRINLNNLNERLCAYFGKQIKQFNISSDYQMANVTSAKVKNGDYSIIFSNFTNKLVQISIRLSSDKNNLERIPLQPNKSKQFKKTALEIFTFLHDTQEIGFQQDKHGPLIIKKLKEVRVNEPTELFSNSAVKYEIKQNGIYFSVCENNCIWNISTHVCMIYFFNQSRQCESRIPIIIEPKQCKFFYRDAKIVYVFIQPKYSNRESPSNFSQLQEKDLIKISEVPYHSIMIRPSKMLCMKRDKSISGRQFLKLVIFNKFKLNNNLPVSVEVNISKVRPFSTSTINLDQMNNNSMNFVIDKINNLALDMGELQIKQDETRRHKIKLNSQDNLSYTIKLQLYSSKEKDQEDSHVLFQGKTMNDKSFTSTIKKEDEGLYEVSSDYEYLKNNSMFPKYQTVIKISTKLSLKNHTSGTIFLAFCINKGLESKKTKMLHSHDYMMLPDELEGILFLQDTDSIRHLSQVDFLSQPTGKGYKYYQLTDLKSLVENHQTEIFWNSYGLEIIKITNSQFIITLYDICLIHNKSTLYVQVGEASSKDKQLVKPESKVQIKLNQPLQNNMTNLRLECRTGSSTCETTLPLNFENPSKNIMYWTVGASCNKDRKILQNNWVQSAQRIIKIIITKLLDYRYCIVLQQNEDFEKDENLLDSRALLNSIKSHRISHKKYVEQQFGYRFFNELPKGYAITIREIDGCLPNSTSSRNEDYIIERQESIRLSNIEVSHKSSKVQVYDFDDDKSVSRSKHTGRDKTSKKSHRIQIQHEKMTSRLKSIEYTIRSQQKICIGLTNLEDKNQDSRKFSIEFYHQDSNIEFKEIHEINLNKLSTDTKILTLKSGNNHELITNNLKTEVKAGIFIHKKKDNKFDFFIRDMDKKDGKEVENLHLTVRQISCVIELSSKPEDSLTLQFENFKLKRTKFEPSSHQQNVMVKLEKILLKEDKNLFIIEMLNMKKPFFKGQIALEKMGQGERMKLLKVQQAPLEIHIRQGILFKVLKRIVEIRSYYFDKNYQIKDSQQIMHKAKEHKSVEDYNIKLEKEFKSLQNGSKIVFIDRLQFEPTNIYFSYQKDDQSEYEEFINDPIIKYFVLIPGISELKVPLPDFQVKNFEGSSKELTKQFVKKIKKNIGSTIFSSISSISLFDSPVAAIDGFFQYTRAIFMIRNA